MERKNNFNSSKLAKKKVEEQEIINELLVHSLANDHHLPSIPQPVEIGYFSVDCEDNFRSDRSSISYLYEGNIRDGLNLNLRDGFNTFIDKGQFEIDELDKLLEWIISEPSSLTMESKLKNLGTDFICWRGLLTNILCSPYEKFGGWKCAVKRFKGVHYMAEMWTDERKKMEWEGTERGKEMMYWGFKFEQYMTVDRPDGTPNTKVPVNNHKAYVSVAKLEINNHSLVYAGEVDCKTKAGEYVELKTNKIIENRFKEKTFIRYKLLKWWAQSVLIGVKKIVAGFRDDSGVVKKVEVMETDKIPELCQKSMYDGWNANGCFNFLNKLLTFIKENIVDEQRIYILEFSASDGSVTCSSLKQKSGTETRITKASKAAATAGNTTFTTTTTSFATTATTMGNSKPNMMNNPRMPCFNVDNFNVGRKIRCSNTFINEFRNRCSFSNGYLDDYDDDDDDCGGGDDGAVKVLSNWYLALFDK